MGRARGTKPSDRATKVRDLGNLVVNNLQTDTQKSPTSLADVLASRYTPNDVLWAGREAEKEISAVDNPDQIRKIVAPLATQYLNVGSLRSSNGMPSNPGTALFVKLLDFLDQNNTSSLQDLREYVRRTNNRLELRELLRSPRTTIDFLEDLWGQKSCEKLSGTTQTRPQTVQKWLGGSSPSSSNTWRIQNLATVVYQLEHECGMPRQDIPAWLEAPQSDLGGQSVEDTFAFSRQTWGMPKEITELLRSMGADL